MGKRACKRTKAADNVSAGDTDQGQWLDEGDKVKQKQHLAERIHTPAAADAQRACSSPLLFIQYPQLNLTQTTHTCAQAHAHIASV